MSRQEIARKIIQDFSEGRLPQVYEFDGIPEGARSRIRFLVTRAIGSYKVTLALVPGTKEIAATEYRVKSHDRRHKETYVGWTP